MQNQITNSLQGKIKGSSIPVDSAIFHTLSQIILLIEEGVHKENNSEISQRVSDLIELISGSVIESLRKDQVIRGLSTLVNAIRKNTVMIHVSPEGYILDANEKMAELSGYTLAELQGAHTRIFNSRVHTEDFWKDFYSSIQSGEIWVGDICNKGKNGELFWLHTIVQPIYDTTGNIFQYIVIRQNITEEKALKEREEAYRERRLDPITGLPGKTALLEDLKNREHQLFLLVHADGMSKFHTDSQHGSIGGDEILRQISIRLPQIVSSSGGMVYKLDGVDFGIVFPDTLERKQAQYVIDGIEKMEFYLADEKIPLTFSTSVTQHISDANETIIRAYDGVQRLRQEKKTDEYRINLETQKIVEKAFERNLVFPEFQEIFRNSLSSFPRKFEVLARMIHPDTHETLYPGYFLGSVESLGLQGKLTREMIRRGAVAIHGTFHELSFNITQQDLIDDTFVDFVQGICSHFSLAPGQFIFEILEKIRNITHPQAVQTLKQLREFGCKIAVDDFGTGESGIHRFTGKGFHYLKVAGEYVKGIDGDNDEGEAKRTFLEIAIYGARKNHMEVIAEGVETKDEWNVLRGLGVDYFQGYYFSRPIPFISDDILGNEQK